MSEYEKTLLFILACAIVNIGYLAFNLFELDKAKKEIIDEIRRNSR